MNTWGIAHQLYYTGCFCFRCLWGHKFEMYSEQNREKNVAEAKTQDKLADILRQQHGNEEERIARAIQEEANRWDVRMHRESAKRQKDLAEIWEHRHATIEARVQQLREQVKEDKADLARRIALDQKAQKEDEDLRAERLARGRELAKLYHEEMVSVNY